MVTINLTIVVQLGLFLLFLWALNKLVLQRVLRNLDARETALEQDAEAANADASAAQSLEAQYAAELTAARRAATVHFERERRAAMDDRNERLARARENGDQEVMAVSRDGQAQIQAQREQFGTLAQDVAEAMAQRLRVKGGGT